MQPMQRSAAIPSDSPTLGVPPADYTAARAGPNSAQLAELASRVEALAALAVLPANAVQELKHKIASQRFDLVVVGQFKRGKTSLVNALISRELLPVAVVPLTSIVTALSHGTELAATVVFESGESQRIALEDLPEYVTERGNPNNGKGVREAHVTSPSPWLQGGIRLVDTPGVGSVYQKNTDVAHRFLPKADAVLFLLSVDQPISQAECDFLASVREHSDKILFVLNKIDLLSEAELEESLAFTRKTLTDVLGDTPRLFPFSARLALNAAVQGRQELVAKSRLPQLSQALRAVLDKEKSGVLVASIGRQLRRGIALTRFDLRLELESLAAPLDELQRKAECFRGKKTEMLRARDELAVLLGNDASRTLQRPVDEDLEAFKAELKLRLAATIARGFDEQRKLPLRRLDRALREAVNNAIRHGFDEWQAGESAALEKTFEAFCARHAAKLDQAIDELFRFASDLFSVPYVAQIGAALHRMDSHFYYKFWGEPGALSLLSSSLVLALPKVLGARLVLDRVRRHALESIEMHAGRLRSDFSQRLDKALTSFRHEVAGKVDGAIEGIERAVAKAVELRAAGHAANAQRCEALHLALHALNAIEMRIAHVTGDVSSGVGGPPAGACPTQSTRHVEPT